MLDQARRCVFSLFLVAASARAAVPSTIAHEGRLLRADGSPEAGLVELTFRLYSVPSGGDPLWVETQSVALGPGGHYAVALGSVTPLPPLDGSALWLGITVKGESEMVPRAPMLSVPFALRARMAEDAERLGGDPSSAILRATSPLDASRLASGTVPFSQLPVGTTAGTVAAGDHGHAAATSSAGGFLSASDKAKLDGIAAGATGVPQGRNLVDWAPDPARWVHQGGSPAQVTLNKSDVLEGDSSFDITVASGAEGTWHAYGGLIPVDPSRRYEGRISAKLVSGAGTFYAGYIAYDKDGRQLTGNGGTYGYFLAHGVTLEGSWSHFHAFISGEGTGTGTFPVGTRFIRPLVGTNYQNVGTTRIDALQFYESGPEETYFYAGAFATSTEWEADVIMNGNYARFCGAMGKSLVRAQTLVAHYHSARKNGYFYPGDYYVGPRYCASDSYYAGSTDPGNPYNVWRYNGGCGCCIETNNWTFERRALITCR